MKPPDLPAHLKDRVDHINSFRWADVIYAVVRNARGLPEIVRREKTPELATPGLRVNLWPGLPTPEC